jgi:CRISPR-associated endonuclease Csn1
MGEKMYLGLDMGTNSVGWAVTNENYELLRGKGKDLWGSRLFDAAETSVERRLHRTARRNGQRQKARINFLIECFYDEIIKLDSGFFVRLKESKLSGGTLREV